MCLNDYEVYVQLMYWLHPKLSSPTLIKHVCAENNEITAGQQQENEAVK